MESAEGSCGNAMDKGELEPIIEPGSIHSVLESEKPMTQEGWDASQCKFINGRYTYQDTDGKNYYWDSESNQWIVFAGPGDSEARAEGNQATTLSGTAESRTDKRHYEVVDNQYYYTDPDSGLRYMWDTVKNLWEEVAREANRSGTTDNSSGKDCSESCLEPHSKLQPSAAPPGHTGDRQADYFYEGNSVLYRDPSDGTVYEWDTNKRAWFPRITEDFLALYHLNYGTQNQPDGTFGHDSDGQKTSPEAKSATVNQLASNQKIGDEKEVAENEVSLRERKKRPVPNPPEWFEMDDQRNTHVYISGLPLDITEEEFLETMQKCGLVMKDPDKGKMKVKLYKDANGQLKGDALCCYIKIESVDLALQILDGYDLRGHTLHVERARFQLKGQFDPSLKPRKKKKKDKEKLRKQQEKLFAWKPEKLRGMRDRNEKVVVIKNLFDPEDFVVDPKKILEYQNDLRQECSKIGQVRKVIVHDRHPDGVAQIFFKDVEEADMCIKLMNHRFFCARRLLAETWDGKTKFKLDESTQEEQERLKGWEDFLVEEN